MTATVVLRKARLALVKEARYADYRNWRCDSHLNPLAYEVDALRAEMLARGASAYGIGIDVSILLVMTTILVVAGSWVYPRVMV